MSVRSRKPRGGPGYLVYTALLTQSGTDAPVATVLQNTIGAIVWTRIAVGRYRGTLATAFPVGKTRVMVDAVGFDVYGGKQIDSSTVQVQVNELVSPHGGYDGGFDATGIEIRVYP